MNHFEVDDAYIMFAKFQICSSNMEAEKIICQITEHVMRTPLLTMHGYVHIIANFSAINDSIQKANDSFNSSHIHVGVLFTTYQKKGSNIRAI